MIEVEHSAQLGRQLCVLHASVIDGTVFRDLDGQGLLASFHMGWLASGSKSLAGQSGMHKALNLPNGHATGVHRDDLVVKAREQSFMFGDQERLEAAIALT